MPQRASSRLHYSQKNWFKQLHGLQELPNGTPFAHTLCFPSSNLSWQNVTTQSGWVHFQIQPGLPRDSTSGLSASPLPPHVGLGKWGTRGCCSITCKTRTVTLLIHLRAGDRSHRHCPICPSAPETGSRACIQRMFYKW